MSNEFVARKYTRNSDGPVAKRAALALGSIETLSASLIGQIEKRSPGNSWGVHKTEHMRELAGQAKEIGKANELTADQTDILRVVLRAHDLGRHIEALRGSSGIPASRGLRHGYESTFLLNRNDAERTLPTEDRRDLEPTEHELFASPIRQFFTPEEQYAVNFAVFWHSERSVPKPKPNDPEYKKLAYKMCYILRDNDKKGIFLDPDYVDTEGVYAQVAKFYGNPEDWKKLKENPAALAEAKQEIAALLRSNQLPTASFLDPNLQKIIANVFNKGISETALESFMNRESIDIKEIEYSWTNYMLMHLAMMFDVKSRGMLQEIHEDPEKYLDPRIKFIELKAGSEQARVVRGVLTGYIKEKLTA